MRLSVSCLVLLVALGLGAPTGPARADQNDERLGKLFSLLKESQDRREAFALTSHIWQIWRHTEDQNAARLMTRGVKAMSAGDYPEALVAFDQVVREAPEYAEGWNKRATVYFLMDDYTASISDISHTLKLEPRHFGAISGLGLNYMAIGEETAALGAFIKALEINPHMVDARGFVEKLKKKLGGRAI